MTAIAYITIKEKISLIRQELQKRGAFAGIFPSGDPHISEYTAERWKIREWISGFYGSAGTVVVTQSAAALWTDSRYFLEAAEALKGSGIVLMKMGLPGTLAIEDWIVGEFRDWAAENAGRSAMNRALFDSEHFPLSQFDQSRLKLKEMELIAVDDLLGGIWRDRPPMPGAAIYEISSTVTGVTREERLGYLRKLLGKQGVSAFLISALDEIAWLLNLRGSDVKYNPVFYAWLLVREQDSLLCTHCEDLPEPLCQSLEDAGVLLADYTDIEPALKMQGGMIAADSASLNVKMARILGEKHKHITSPVQLWKARKTASELVSTRKVMEMDGVAMVKLLRWLENVTKKGGKLTELMVATHIDDFRAEQEGFIGSSFASVVGFQEHAAIIHYSVDEKSDKAIDGEGLLLIDSGGQYRNGTTDITRTIFISGQARKCPKELRRQYTLVLKGHIALARAVFPEGTIGSQLDSLARRPLWEQGLNYGHGTGHGVGFALNVHEGPQSIGLLPTAAALEPGMVCSNEPGYYRDGSHGIRIENLVAVKQHPSHQGFLCFETLSLCPLELELVQKELLSHEEIAWLNDYHRQVRDRLSPLLDSPLQDWLSQKTREL